MNHHHHFLPLHARNQQQLQLLPMMIHNQKKKRMIGVAMTPEEYQALQNQPPREVYDPISGRTRLIKGTGEIIERIVSYDQHCNLNQTATRMDGTYFASQIQQRQRLQQQNNNQI
mmetsp:Transcript_7746/g.10802  ORF Transcript_7746/g.10802 Transcript_7746/m.10802 type:complete len:115 (+) Transcript_7746:358-702(+)